MTSQVRVQTLQPFGLEPTACSRGFGLRSGIWASFGLFFFGPFGENSGANSGGIAKFPEISFAATNRIPVSFWNLSIRDEFPQPRTAKESGSVRAGKPG